MGEMSPANETTHSHDAWQAEPTLDELTRQDIWTLRRGFLERLWPDVIGLNVLEVGSGPAHDSLTFAQRGASVTALDCSRTGLDLAERMYRSLDLPLRTVQGDARRLPFEDGAFDLAFNAGVLEHFDDEALQEVIDEMIRVVRPGGHVLAFCPNRHNVFYQNHLRRVGEHSYEFERAFSAAELRRRFIARGLPVVRVSGVHIHPAPNYLLPDWLPKHHRIEPFFRRCFAPWERARRWDRVKSILGQDFVLWAEVPQSLASRTALTTFRGGQAVRDGRCGSGSEPCRA